MSDNPYEYTTPVSNTDHLATPDDNMEVSRINFVTKEGFMGEEIQTGGHVRMNKPRVLFHNVQSNTYVKELS